MKNIPYIAIIILVVIIFLQRECRRPDPPDPQPDTIAVIDTVYDTTLITKEVPKPYPVEKIVVKEIFVDVDTSEILKEYHTKNIYDRLLMDDTVAFIRVIDTVYRNQLWGSSVEFRNRLPVIIHETYVIHPSPQKFQLYVGGTVLGSQTGLGIGPTIYFKTKKDHLYGLGYDAIGKNVHLHMGWKISFGGD